MTLLGCTRQCKKNSMQHHIHNKSKFLYWCLINGLKCTVENILMYLNTLLKSHEIKNVGGMLVKPAPKKKRKTITTKAFCLVTNVYENDNFSR